MHNCISWNFGFLVFMESIGLPLMYAAYVFCIIVMLNLHLLYSSINLTNLWTITQQLVLLTLQTKHEKLSRWRLFLGGSRIFLFFLPSYRLMWYACYVYRGSILPRKTWMLKNTFIQYIGVRKTNSVVISSCPTIIHRHQPSTTIITK